jgi:purine-binding chemotaxis protein CheW
VSGGEARDPIVQLCAFRVGDEEYVVDLRRIREIVQPLPITAVPRAPEWMEGVVNLRGEVLPVLDVRKRLGLGIGPRPPSRRAKLLVAQVAGRMLALLVDGVCEVVRIPRSALGPPPPLEGAAGARLFVGVCMTRPSAAAAARARTADAAREGAGAVPRRVRLLLDVKALLEPSARPQAPDGTGRA